jgi:hypothetical protein
LAHDVWSLGCIIIGWLLWVLYANAEQQYALLPGRMFFYDNKSSVVLHKVVARVLRVIGVEVQGMEAPAMRLLPRRDTPGPQLCRVGVIPGGCWEGAGTGFLCYLLVIG